MDSSDKNSKLDEDVKTYCDVLRSCSLPEVGDWKEEDLERVFRWSNYFKKVRQSTNCEVASCVMSMRKPWRKQNSSIYVALKIDTIECMHVMESRVHAHARLETSTNRSTTNDCLTALYLQHCSYVPTLFQKVHSRCATRASLMEKFDKRFRELGRRGGWRFGGEPLSCVFLGQSQQYLTKVCTTLYIVHIESVQVLMSYIYLGLFPNLSNFKFFLRVHLEKNNVLVMKF